MGTDGTLPAPLGATIRHRDLPVVDRSDVDAAAGFVRLVGYVASLPLTILGIAVVAAGLAFDWTLLAVVAGVVTLAILVALREDMRLHRALELVGRGEDERARPVLREVAGSARRGHDQRQRARAHLASIAWRSGDLEGALRWARARVVEGRAGRGEPRDSRFLGEATEVQLLALAGRGEQARARLEELGEPPPGAFHELVAITSHLLVMFVEHEPRGSAADLRRWERRAMESDGVGAALLLLAWAFLERGEAGRALTLLERASVQGDAEHLAGRYPMLWRWAETHKLRLHYTRG